MTDKRVAIVTGASSGIGWATAKRLAGEGMSVLANYVGNADGAASAVEACKTAGADAIAVQGNVAEDADCRRIVNEALDRWGRVDVLINNAGTTKIADPKDLDALSAEDFRRIYDVNVIGTYQMTRAARSALAAAGRGAIVNTSSIAGVAGMGSSIAYAASKGALNTLTLSLARSLAPEIRVNAVCPGYVDSEWWDSLEDETIDKMKARSASAAMLRRVAPSDEIAETIVMLALHSRSVTGQCLVVDNGMLLNIGQPLGAAHGT